MKKVQMKGTVMVWVGSGVGIGVLWYGLQFLLPQSSFLYSFLLNAWLIQLASSWLFVVGLVFWVQRSWLYKKEGEALQKIRLPDHTIVREQARGLMESMPAAYRQTLTFRRVRELLQALEYGEDILRMNEELSRRDVAGVERGHQTLESLGQLIPVIGFLGTVVGLAMGMLSFPDIANLDALRAALKSFAASLSVAFNTTLLALGYAIVLMVLTSVLRQREEALVDRVDELARLVIAKIKVSMLPASQPEDGPNQVVQLLQNALRQWREEFSDGLDKIAQHLASANGGGAKQIEEAFKAGAREMGAILSRKFDEIKDGLHSPPRYQVIVQPLQEAHEHDRK